MTSSAVTLPVVALLLAASLGAQEVPRPLPPPQVYFDCEKPGPAPEPAGDCTGQVARADSAQYYEIILKLRSGGRPITRMIRFSANSGTFMPDSVWPSPNGEVRTRWFRSGGGDSVRILAEINSPTAYGLRYIKLTPRKKVAGDSMKVVMREFRAASAWYEKTSTPAIVELMQLQRRAMRPDTIVPITADSTCSRYRAAFTRAQTATSVLPDTGRFTVTPVRRPRGERWPQQTAEFVLGNKNPEQNGCLALAEWHLGTGVGQRAMRVHLLSATGTTALQEPIDILTHARPLPRIFAGLNLTRHESRVAVAPKQERTVQVERIQPDGSKATFETKETIQPAREDTIRGAWEPGASGGLVGAPIPALREFTMSAGVDLKNPSRNFFAGFSLIHLVRPSLESLPLDIHLIGHWARRDIAVTANCPGGASLCTETDLRFEGVGIMGIFDAGSALADVIKKLTS
jgi:hypothetical protein